MAPISGPPNALAEVIAGKYGVRFNANGPMGLRVLIPVRIKRTPMTNGQFMELFNN